VGSSTGTYLQEGDIVEVEIDRIGTLRNRVSAMHAAAPSAGAGRMISADSRTPEVTSPR
jgi:fumarylacetoacetate (FAA) hydrolase family protein